MKKRFEVGDPILLLNSKLRLFPGKQRSRWSGQFKVTKVFHHAIVEVWCESTGMFKVNGQRLKPYNVGESTDNAAIYHLSKTHPPSSPPLPPPF